MSTPPEFARAQILSLEDPPEYILSAVYQHPIRRDPASSLTEHSLIHACYAGDLDQVEELFSLPHSPESTGIFGATPLSAACSAGHAHIVRWLLAHGASADGPSHSGSPLLSAMHSARDSSECMILIKEALGNDFAVELDDDFFSPALLPEAHIANFLLALSWMPITPEWANRFLYHRAPKACHAAIDALIARGADINHEDPTTGLTPLIHAITSRNSRPFYQSHTLDCLTSRGASVHQKTRMGLAPLTAAAVMGSLPACQILLKLGANPLESLTPECFPQAAYGRLPSAAAEAGRYTELARHLRAIEASWTEARELSEHSLMGRPGARRTSI